MKKHWRITRDGTAYTACSLYPRRLLDPDIGMLACWRANFDDSWMSSPR